MATTAGWLVAPWPHFRSALTLASLAIMTVLALLANVCYCAEYVVDIPTQLSAFSATWKPSRSILWLPGNFFPFLLANYSIADEIDLAAH